MRLHRPLHYQHHFQFLRHLLQYLGSITSAYFLSLSFLPPFLPHLLLSFPPHTSFLCTSLFLPACLVTFPLGAPWCRRHLSDGAEGLTELCTTGVEFEWRVATTPCLSFLAFPSCQFTDPRNLPIGPEM